MATPIVSGTVAVLGPHSENVSEFVDGWLLFSGSDASLAAVRSEACSLRVSGAPVQVEPGLNRDRDLSVSRSSTGTLAFVRSRGEADSLFADPYLRHDLSRQNYDFSRDGRFAVFAAPAALYNSTAANFNWRAAATSRSS